MANYRRTAIVVAKVFKGENRADLPADSQYNQTIMKSKEYCHG